MIQHIEKAVAAAEDRILAAERYLWEHPETGFREKASSAYMRKQFEELGYSVTAPEDITGFYTVIDTGRPGPELMVLSELDSVICPAHPQSNPQTGAVHACGHHAQGAAMVGVAAALRDPAVLSRLCGRIRLCAVPAEEMLETEYREGLRDAGTIRYFNGKTEYLRRGYFDGVDMAFMVHHEKQFKVRSGSIGFISKIVTYQGKAAHAGGSPWDGCNALYAAMAGLNAVNAIRETFKDEDHIRVHPIITHGGDMVNAIPEQVRLELQVRGGTFEAIRTAAKRVDRALCGAALSLGAKIHIATRPGYAPLCNNADMSRIAAEAAAVAMPEETFHVYDTPDTSCTDMGDLSCVMPVTQPYCPGVAGTSHGSDYRVTDRKTACVKNAVWQLTMIELLLGNDGARAKEVLKNYHALYEGKAAFLAEQDGFYSDRDAIVYRADGKAEVDLT